MNPKIKLNLHLQLLKVLTEITANNINTVTKTPQQHFIKLMVMKLHQKFYTKTLEKRFSKSSEPIKMTVKYEEAYALDLFLQYAEMEEYERNIISGFILQLNQSIQ